MKLTKEQENWINEIKPYYAEAIEKGINGDEAIKYASKRYSDMLTEMSEGKTERSQLARQTIKEQVYNTINA